MNSSSSSTGASASGSAEGARPGMGGPRWFSVEGMTCQNCARKAREAAEGVPGVAGASVDLGAGRLKVRWGPEGGGDPEAVARAVTAAGYKAVLLDPVAVRAPAMSAPGSEWRFNVVLGGAVTLFLMLAEWGLGWMHARWYPVLAFALAAPVQVWGGARFYRGAWNQLRQGSANMDTLVSLGSSAAFGYSVWQVFGGGGGHVYFMESASIITLISVGHWLEAVATSRAAGAVQALMNLAPALARRIDGVGLETEVPAGELMPGDRIVVRPGDTVPTDAMVVEGASAVEESMLTGESKPVEKAIGSVLYAGTRNVDGRIVARVTATGEGTALARILAAVERAQNSRADIQRLADRVSSVFVPAVVVLALLTALGWGLFPEQARQLHAWLGQFLWPMPVPEGVWGAAIVQATSVLIIACPCAMGLATPVAIMAGTNVAALRGILIRDGVALEKAGRIDTVVFDKTGTLTEGQLRVVAVRDLRPEPERVAPLQELVGTLVRGSSHPVARTLGGWSGLAGSGPDLGQPKGGGQTSEGGDAAGLGGAGVGGSVLLRKDLAFRPLRGEAPVGGLPVAGLRPLPGIPARSTALEGGWLGWRELRGRGIEARRGEGTAVHRLGSLIWLHENGVQDVAAEKGGASARGATVTLVGLAAEERLLALFELRDALRSDAHDVVSGLHGDGFTVGLLTGDAWLAAEAVAREAGISSAEVLADVKPEQKADSLARLQATGRRVAFVGDGINDGPALAQADLGIAVGRATDVARESADVVLIGGGLGSIREAIGLAQATLKTIRQNLFWAFFYNAAAIPLAMAGFFNPVLCALAMGMSDLLVIGNALQLRRWRLRSGRGRKAPGRGRALGGSVLSPES